MAVMLMLYDWKVTTGMVEGGDNLLPGLWLLPVG